MKRFAGIVLALVLSTGAMYAQKNALNDCYFALNDYARSKDPAALAKAKDAIDKATVHPDTKDNPDTWVKRGTVYLKLYQKDFNDKVAAHADITNANKKQMQAYFETPTENLVEATNAYLKAKALDTKNNKTEDIQKGLADCYSYTQNVGIAMFNQQKYAEALPMFELAASIPATRNVFDTASTSNAAVAAMNSKNYERAAVHYKKLADAGAGKGNSWMMLGRVYQDMGDTAKYAQTIAEGLKKYPNDADLLTEDVNLKLSKGQVKEAVEQLNALVAQRPNDAQLNALVGNVYDRMANPTDGEGKMLPNKPAQYEDFMEKSIGYYKKAIELNPNDFIANYNLGVLYYNRALYYYEQSQKTIADAAKYKDMWEKPLPDAAKYLEAAHKIDPKDMGCLIALRNCYSQMSDNENYLRIKEEIKKLQAGG